MSVDPVVAALAQCALILVFAAASLHKWRDRTHFEATVTDYRLLPRSFVPAAVVALASVEAGVALAIALPTLRPAGGIAAALLLALYSGAIVVNLARGRREIDCGCLGPGRRQSLSGWLVARNGVLAVAALVLLMPVVSRPIHGVDLGTGIGALATLVLLWHAAHHLGETGPLLRRSP